MRRLRRERRDGPTPGGRGRFPGYDVMREAPAWDAGTRRVVEARLAPPGALRFFDAAEASCARALLDRLLGQDAEPRIPLLVMVDGRLARGEGDGWRHADMPEDGDAWRISLAALDAEAQDRHGVAFAALTRAQQHDVIEDVRTEKHSWRGLPAPEVFDLWIRYACFSFYAHPWAWNEIGFGGPAYPRGYANLGFDKREHWEVPERSGADPVAWADRREAARRLHEPRHVP